VTQGHETPAMGERSVNGLLTMAVRLHGLALGRPVDVFLDRADLRVVGADVLCGDEEHRFLPFAAAKLDGDGIAIASPLILLDEAQLDFYRSRTFSFGAIRDRRVQRRDRDLGLLRDLRLNSDFSIAAIVVEADGAEEALPFEPSIQFDPRSRSAA
jgi:hypothetical protein